MKSEYGCSKTGTNDKKAIMRGLFSSEKFWQRQKNIRWMEGSANSEKNWPKYQIKNNMPNQAEEKESGSSTGKCVDACRR